MVDLRKVVFSLYDAITVNAVLQHGTGNFKSSFALAFFNTTLFTQLDALLDPLLDTLLNTFLLELLCDGHECVSVLRHTLCQFAYKGFGVGCFACLDYIVYQRYDLG